MSSELKSTSRARFLPMRRGNRAMGPPPATRPTPTSHCDRTASSRLAKLMSHARAISLPFPVARPRIKAIDTKGARVRRTRMSGHASRPVGPRSEEHTSELQSLTNLVCRLLLEKKKKQKKKTKTQDTSEISNIYTTE